MGYTIGAHSICLLSSPSDPPGEYMAWGQPCQSSPAHLDTIPFPRYTTHHLVRNHARTIEDENGAQPATSNSQPATCFLISPHVQRWDQLVPVCKGGETILGNMVPACARCDDAKRQFTFEEFMDGSGGHSPLSRGVKVLVDAYRKRTGYW